jgi:(heptosyl)LPS beta-1,4-glucosyltransferase
MPKIPLRRCSAAIIAYNEARYIADCIASLAGLTDEVIVLLDSRTQDATATIAERLGARVVPEVWRGFPAQRNRALDLCRSEWILFIDADERLSPELRDEIAGLVQATPAAVGYWIPRYNYFFGKALRGGGWYPDKQLRLLRRDAARYDEMHLVHESATLQGDAGSLREHLIHLNIERLDELWYKQSRYALAEARTLQHQGRRSRWRNFVGGPAREFWRRYVRLGGWRDGRLGLFLCATMAWFELVKFAFLRTLNGR